MGVVIGEQGGPDANGGGSGGESSIVGGPRFICLVCLRSFSRKSLSSVHHSLLVNIFGAIRLASDIWAQLKRSGRRSEAVEGPVVRHVNGYNFIANQS